MVSAPAASQLAADDAAPRSPLAVSLVIPVRNETDTLATLIASVRQQTFAPAEVLLVDGGSTDATVAVARRLTEGDARFRVIEAGAATPGRGRNVGSAGARCEWLAYTDAGIRLEPTWLERLAREVERDPSVEVVYGNFEPARETLWQRVAAISYLEAKQERGGGRMRGPFIASSLLRRSVWQHVGGFPDLRAAEDLMFMERVRAQGFKTAWAPAATVWWYPPTTPGQIFRRFVLFSRYNIWVGRQRYWHYGVARIYLLSLFFVALAAVHSLWWLLVPLLVALARAGKTIWQRRDGRTLLWALNPARFVCVGLVLAITDAATFVGWAQAYWQRRPQSIAAAMRQRPADE